MSTPQMSEDDAPHSAPRPAFVPRPGVIGMARRGGSMGMMGSRESGAGPRERNSRDVRSSFDTRPGGTLDGLSIDSPNVPSNTRPQTQSRAARRFDTDDFAKQFPDVVPAGRGVNQATPGGGPQGDDDGGLFVPQDPKAEKRRRNEAGAVPRDATGKPRAEVQSDSEDDVVQPRRKRRKHGSLNGPAVPAPTASLIQKIGSLPSSGLFSNRVKQASNSQLELKPEEPEMYYNLAGYKLICRHPLDRSKPCYLSISLPGQFKKAIEEQHRFCNWYDITQKVVGTAENGYLWVGFTVESADKYDNPNVKYRMTPRVHVQQLRPVIVRYIKKTPSELKFYVLVHNPGKPFSALVIKRDLVFFFSELSTKIPGASRLTAPVARRTVWFEHINSLLPASQKEVAQDDVNMPENNPSDNNPLDDDPMDVNPVNSNLADALPEDLSLAASIKKALSTILVPSKDDKVVIQELLGAFHTIPGVTEELQSILSFSMLFCKEPFPDHMWKHSLSELQKKAWEEWESGSKDRISIADFTICKAMVNKALKSWNVHIDINTVVILRLEFMRNVPDRKIPQNLQFYRSVVRMAAGNAARYGEIDAASIIDQALDLPAKK